MPKRTTTAANLVLGAAAGAIMALAPIAGAEPSPCNPDDVQCQQQQKQPDPAAIVGSATDQANQALNQAPAVSPYPTSGPPGGVCSRINGFPVYIPPGGRELLPGEVPPGQSMRATAPPRTRSWESTPRNRDRTPPSRSSAPQRHRRTSSSRRRPASSPKSVTPLRLSRRLRRLPFRGVRA